MIGSTISHYRILEKLGEGGMGVVYKAEDLRLNRLVALKFLSGANLGEEQKKRFIREAQTAARLQHPNICTIYEVDEVDGRVFLAMGFVAGQTLAGLLEQGPLPVERAVEIALQTAEALEAAHAGGVVHRDVKTGNVMITPAGNAVMLDFGLAQVGGVSRITRSGATVGTAAYMSPEQAQGETVDHRSDIWSLGVVLYEMLAGRLPFRGEYELAVMYNIVNEAPEPLSSARPDVPGDLEAVAARLLAKNPASRYQSAGELAEDLRIVLAGLRGSAAVTAQSSRRTLRATPAASRPRLSAPIAAVAVLLLLVLAGVVWKQFPEPSARSGFLRLPESKHLVVLPFEDISRDPEMKALCDGLAETLTAKLTGLEQFRGDLMVVPASEVRAGELTSVSRARQAFGVNLAVTGSLQRRGGRYRLTANLVDAPSLRQLRSETIDVSEDELAMLQDGVVSRVIGMLELELDVATREALSEGGTMEPGAYARYLRGLGYLSRFDQRGNVQRAIESFESAIREDPNYAPAYAGLAEAFWREYTRTGDASWADRALERAYKAVELNGRLAVARVQLGDILARIGKTGEAEREFEAALDLDPLNAEARRGLARVYRNTGRIEEAEHLYLKAVELRPNDWRGHTALGVFYNLQARYEEAESALLKAIELTPGNAVNHRNLGGVYILLGRHDDARSHLQKSIEIQPSAAAYSNLATVEYFQRRYDRAVEAYRAAIELSGSDYRLWGNLAEARRAAGGMEDEALRDFDHAIELAHERLELDPSDSQARSRLALYLAKTGRSAEARNEMDRIQEAARGDSRILFIEAVIHEADGRRAQALGALERALEKGYSLSDIEADFGLRELRTDQRYAELVDRFR